MKASGFQRKAGDLKRLRPMVAYKFVLTYSIETRLLAKCARSNLSQRRLRTSLCLACVASVSVRSLSKDRGTRVKDRAKNGGSKRAGRGWVSFLPSPLPPPPSFFGSSFISRAVKTENPLPRSFFAPNPNGNACYEGQCWLLRRHRGNDMNGIDDKKKSVHSFQFH